MAIVQMRKISVYALKKHRKNILEHLQRQGVLEITCSPFDDRFVQEDTSSQRNVFLKSSAAAATAWEAINKYCGEKKSLLASFEGREHISDEDYYKFVSNKDEIMRVAAEINLCEKKQAELKAEILKLENQCTMLNAWLELDISMRFKGTHSTRAFIGSFPDAKDSETLLKELAVKAPDVSFDLEILSTSTDQTCVCAICHKKYSQQAEEALGAIGFSYPPLPTKATPRERLDELKSRIIEYEKQIDDNISQITKKIKGHKNFLSRLSQY